MTLIQSAIAHIGIGATLVALGFYEFSMQTHAQLDEAVFPNLEPETLLIGRRAAGVLLMLAGMGICFGSLL